MCTHYNQLNLIGVKIAIPGFNTRNVKCLPIFLNENPYVKKVVEIILFLST